ncbi:MAG: hypothetical protein ACR2KG_07060 [Nocardioidaceae bacterium]
MASAGSSGSDFASFTVVDDDSPDDFPDDWAVRFGASTLVHRIRRHVGNAGDVGSVGLQLLIGGDQSKRHRPVNADAVNYHSYD